MKKFYRQDGKATAWALSLGRAYHKGNRTLTKLHGVYKVASMEEIRYFETINQAYKYMHS